MTREKAGTFSNPLFQRVLGFVAIVVGGPTLVKTIRLMAAFYQEGRWVRLALTAIAIPAVILLIAWATWLVLHNQAQRTDGTANH